jgi:putative transcriptional regulator
VELDLAFPYQKLNLMNLKLLIYMKQHRNRVPRVGDVLLSEPFLLDENFSRSVVLICEHEGETGTVGFVLNKPSILNLEDLVSKLDFLSAEVFVGGPVEQNTLHFIYAGEQLVLDSKPLGNELWWGGDFSSLIQCIHTGKLNLTQVRFFMGYCGWSAGQLETELLEDTWIVYTDPILKAHLSVSPDQLWRSLMRRMGGEFEIQSNYPIDPRLN